MVVIVSDPITPFTEPLSVDASAAGAKVLSGPPSDVDAVEVDASATGPKVSSGPPSDADAVEAEFELLHAARAATKLETTTIL
jgi:hypothetical protein